ncbi:MAG: HD domain-containing protein [Prolixibacteraceae bacterium]|nr:HD domain-containing protein [Prolixibacteraceae bacterium]
MNREYEISVITQEKNQSTNQSTNLEVIEFELHKIDMTTRMHQIRVAELSEKIGTKLGLSKEELADLVQAAEIHDLGKMGIPLEILNKPDKLTQEEYTIIKAHVEIGVEILNYNKAILSERVIELVRNHHETLDGEGYPRGLKGEQLNKQCRILTVADRYEALTAKRPYKEYMDIKKAFHVLAEDVHNGKIDASVVKALNEVVKERTISKDVKKSRGLTPDLHRMAW